jgi:hypothetical protein
MHGEHRGGPQAAGAGRMLGSAVNTIVKASLGAGVAVVGAYLLSRSREQRGLEERIGRLEAMLQQMETKGGDAGR